MGPLCVVSWPIAGGVYLEVTSWVQSRAGSACISPSARLRCASRRPASQLRSCSGTVSRKRRSASTMVSSERFVSTASVPARGARLSSTACCRVLTTQDAEVPSPSGRRSMRGSAPISGRHSRLSQARCPQMKRVRSPPPPCTMRASSPPTCRRPKGRAGGRSRARGRRHAGT